MKKWYNPSGKSIVNGGVAVRLNDYDTEAELFIVRSLGNGKVAAFVARLSDEDFLEGGSCQGLAEKLVHEEAGTIFEAWEEQQIAGFFLKAAEELPFEKLKDVFPLDVKKQPNDSDIRYYQEYDELIISRAKALGIL